MNSTLLTCILFLTTATAQFTPITTLLPTPSYTGCLPSGPLLPPPTNLPNSKYIKSATDNLTKALDSALKGDIRAGWAVDNVSFSLAFASPGHDRDHYNKPVWEYHHRGKLNEKGVDEADGDTQYLIGSVSKVFSDLVLLKTTTSEDGAGVSLQDPVTKFFPELRDKGALVMWEDVTLEALAGHLGGIPPNSVYEFYDLQPLYESLGLPHLNQSDYPNCGVVGLPGSKSCTEQDILTSLLSTHPVAPVNSRPVYSQLSFLIISLALERATGKNYSQLLHETVIQPLQLTNTGVSPGDSDRAIIPPGMSNWGSDFGLNAPGGGLYSTTNDLTHFINAILTQTQTILPTPAEVRKWLSPSSISSSSLTTLVGRPWEILRTTNLVPEYPHTIDIYGKSGGAVGYRAQMSIVDQYKVGFVLLTAGPVDSLNILNQAVLGMVMPAVEREAREQARRFTGRWSVAGGGSDGDRVQANITMDTGPGLKLSSITRNGSSILNAIRKIWEYQFTSLGFGILTPDLRIYPTGIETPVPHDEIPALLTAAGHPSQSSETADLVRQDWRVNLDIVPLDGEAMSDLPGQASLDAFCASWQTGDWMVYGGEALDRVVFVVDRAREGVVVGVEVPGARSGLLVGSSIQGVSG